MPKALPKRSLDFLSGKASTTDPEYESRLQLAISDLANGTHKTMSAAARAHNVNKQYLSILSYCTRRQPHYTCWWHWHE
ncbi:hypothetical protein BJV78DRAFT_1168055 [Lactifluus subvellereus]|nr:hypothetical protein BJV78DRAFT_1168055 [Lactifluus subvellereus]